MGSKVTSDLLQSSLLIGISLALLISWNGVGVEAFKSCGSDLVSNILSELFKNYNPEVRPPPGDNATLVTVNSAILNIVWVDEKIHQWNLDMYLRQEWNDPRLQYGKSIQGCSKFKYITIYTPEGLAKIWKPNLSFITGLEEKTHDFMQPNEVIRIYPNGDIWYSIHPRATLFCSGAGSRPGEYVCPISIFPYGPMKDEIELRWLAVNPIQIDRSGILLDDHVVGDITTRAEDWVSQSGIYSKLVADVHFLRKACLA